MAKLIIGIQGGMGSVNERGCRFFAQKYGWTDYEISYLISTDNVLKALRNGTIHFGTFAWESTRAGLVQETQYAVQHHRFSRIDEHWFCPEHALLAHGIIDESQPVMIISHHQALNEHASFLHERFPGATLRPESDTAVAAQNLKDGMYPENTIVVAPLCCAEIYGLTVFLADMPSNEGYLTKIVLAGPAT